MATFSFYISGEPVAKARPRFSNGRAYTPRKTTEWENTVRRVVRKRLPENWKPWEGEVSIALVFNMKIPKSTTKKRKEEMHTHTVKHSKRPDLDNLVKAILDGLNGVAYVDDGQVTDIYSSKRYADEPGVLIVLFFNN